ncbi:HD domain-containing protein [Actinomadura rubrisoli]|uniref:HD domain-containing protein n=1 Tax=Actinomadura rubrisoli TaxID=2530368 RepID=A0A4R5BMY5_9ACTN|nr:HD domain-containing protein [Actinomadura rubrisoli]TDD88181.1 HD domain-containing protein [Actinomadura rubrisoli]
MTFEETAVADRFAEFAMPDTDLTRKAYDLVFDTEPTSVAHHSARTYLFARAVGGARGLRPGSDYDDEVLFLSCVLHDVGLTAQGDGDQRFEVDGADVAAAFLRDHGLADDRVQIVWEAIALHTSRGIATRMRAEISLTHAGTGLDVVGPDVGEPGVDALPEGFADRAHAAYPRLKPGCGVHEAILAQIARDPGKAPMGSMPFEFARQAGAAITVPIWTEVVARAWPGVA